MHVEKSRYIRCTEPCTEVVGSSEAYEDPNCNHGRGPNEDLARGRTFGFCRGCTQCLSRILHCLGNFGGLYALRPTPDKRDNRTSAAERVSSWDFRCRGLGAWRRRFHVSRGRPLLVRACRSFSRWKGWVPTSALIPLAFPDWPSCVRPSAVRVPQITMMSGTHDALSPCGDSASSWDF